MVEHGKIMDFANEDMALNEADSSSSDELNGIQNRVQITIKDGAIWMPIYTRPLHEFRLCEYCKDHEIPFYLPLVPGFKIHNVYKGQKRHTYKKEIMKPMLSSYIFAQLTEDQKKQIWRSNSVNSIWNVTIEEQPQFVEELHGLQMMEALALSTKLEFKKETDQIAIFEFDEIDKASDACRNVNSYDYVSVFYKDEKNKKFYLVLSISGNVPKTTIDDFNKACNSLAEYGIRIRGKVGMNQAYYEEHYKVVIKEDAVSKLSRL